MAAMRLGTRTTAARRVTRVAARRSTAALVVVAPQVAARARIMLALPSLLRLRMRLRLYPCNRRGRRSAACVVVQHTVLALLLGTAIVAIAIADPERAVAVRHLCLRFGLALRFCALQCAHICVRALKAYTRNGSGHICCIRNRRCVIIVGLHGAVAAAATAFRRRHRYGAAE